MAPACVLIVAFAASGAAFVKLPLRVHLCAARWVCIWHTFAVVQQLHTWPTICCLLCMAGLALIEGYYACIVQHMAPQVSCCWRAALEMKGEVAQHILLMLLEFVKFVKCVAFAGFLSCTTYSYTCYHCMRCGRDRAWGST